MLRYIYRTLHPDMYHGTGMRPPFFEGWYYKLISAGEKRRYAVIPGVMLGGNAHAFIQVLNGADGRSAYYRFPVEDFWASERDFEVRIGPNHFRRDRLSLNLHGESGRIRGSLRFSGLSPWPVRPWSPGIMGPYAWAPFMETYHGVVSLDHKIHGSLEIEGRRCEFSAGRGYTEKDWGQSFPAAWIWFQCNHFDQQGTSLTASIAIIPWLRSAFRGFIIGLWLEGRLHRFATYTGARTERLEVSERQVHWTVADRHERLEMTAIRGQTGPLRGPNRKEMGIRVDETLLSEVTARLSDRNDRVLFDGRGRHAGLEAQGDLDRLLRMK